MFFLSAKVQVSINFFQFLSASQIDSDAFLVFIPSIKHTNYLSLQVVCLLVETFLFMLLAVICTVLLQHQAGIQVCINNVSVLYSL